MLNLNLSPHNYVQTFARLQSLDNPLTAVVIGVCYQYSVKSQ